MNLFWDMNTNYASYYGSDIRSFLIPFPSGGTVGKFMLREYILKHCFQLYTSPHPHPPPLPHTEKDKDKEREKERMDKEQE